MISLQWDWGVALAIVISGVLAGYFVVPLAWPARTALHVKPPQRLAFYMRLTLWGAFFGPLAVARFVAGEVVQLQATVLYLVWVSAGAVGTWLRR